MTKYLQDNTIIEMDQAAVSPLDRGYYFGDGVYEVFRIYNGRLFEVEAHLARLVRSCGEIGISLPYPADEIEGLLLRLAAADPVETGILYMQITRGCSPRNHAFPPEGTRAVLTGYCKELPRPLAKFEHGFRVITAPDIRWLRCDIKTLNLLGNVLAKQEAVSKGADEVILHRSGIVTECSSSNLMMVKNGVVRTHPANHLILHGVTRQAVLRVAGELGVEVAEAAFDLDELRTADEVFLTGTTTEVMPVVEIDGVAVKGGLPGPVTRQLHEAFEKLFL
ncbi:MAG: dat [Paenibacillaceae bacterium]|jgi:D-alanine transaminase|nr:dat [Paenibacillaceae bacterium]